MMRMAALSVLILGLLSACGHTPEERAVSGALIGGAVGAFVGLAAEPRYDGHYRSDRRHYHGGHRHHRRHDHGSWRRHRDYDDCCYY